MYFATAGTHPRDLPAEGLFSSNGASNGVRNDKRFSAVFQSVLIIFIVLSDDCFNNISRLKNSVPCEKSNREIDPLQDLSQLRDLRDANPQLSIARHMGDYQMWLQFTDGRAGIVDFSDDLWGEDLEPLRDPITFAELTLDEGLATLSWERGGIDISPSYLYSKLESVQ